jgi:hypothetical protein
MTPVVLGAKFATSLLLSVVHPLANMYVNFRKKFEMTLMLFSGAWGNMIHEKNLKQKIS